MHSPREPRPTTSSAHPLDARQGPAPRRSGPLALQPANDPPARRPSSEHKVSWDADAGEARTAISADALERALAALLEPFGAMEVDAWCRRANVALCELTGADAAAFALPSGPGGALRWTTDVAPAHASLWAAEGAPTLGAPREWLLALAAEIGREWTTVRPAGSMIGAPFAGSTSAFPFHGALTIRMATRAGDALAWLHFAAPRRANALERGASAARLATAALRVAVGRWWRLHGREDVLERVTEALADAVALACPIGGVMHANRSARALLSGDDDRTVLHAAIARLAAAAYADGATHSSARTRRAAYALTAARLDGADDAGLVLVTVRPDAAPLDDAALRVRFRLTPREIEVARHLAAGLTNRELAARLGTREATARHHVEKVISKLGVNSRAKVGAVLRNETA